MTKLQNAALCGLADLTSLYTLDMLDLSAKRTIVELYDALFGENIDVSAYHDFRESAATDVSQEFEE